jgi:hypothetical protein
MEMKDLFAYEPFHKELHEIMLKKGYRYMRIYDVHLKASYDAYKKEKGRWVLSFWEDDYILMADKDGNEAPLDVFIAETDGIFRDD